MTKVARTGPLPHDPEQAALEARRREALADNVQYQEGRKQAESSEVKNLRERVATLRNDLARCRGRTRGNLRAVHDQYKRIYNELERWAQILATKTGENVRLPANDPPPLPDADVGKMRVIKPGQPDMGLYHERGSRPTGVQPNFANVESEQHQAWLSTQGAPAIDTNAGHEPGAALAARKARAGVTS